MTLRVQVEKQKPTAGLSLFSSDSLFADDDDDDDSPTVDLFAPSAVSKHACYH